MKNCASIILPIVVVSLALATRTGSSNINEPSEGLINELRQLQKSVQAIKASLRDHQEFKEDQEEFNEVITQSLDMVNLRVSAITLLATNAKPGSEFACGSEDREKPDNLFFMYGSRDGTGCNVKNRNYYKQVQLSIPPAPVKTRPGGTGLGTPKMKFVDAGQPYSTEKYKSDGYVDNDGKVQNGGLGCAAYTSVVLHRMRDGDDWLRMYDINVHHWYGNRIAKHFGLKREATIPAEMLLDATKTSQLIKSAKLKADHLYLFYVRQNERSQVGFLRIKADGQLDQAHYAGIQPYNGLASGDFRKWLQSTEFSNSEIDLYHIPE